MLLASCYVLFLPVFFICIFVFSSPQKEIYNINCRKSFHVLQKKVSVFLYTCIRIIISFEVFVIFLWRVSNMRRPSKEEFLLSQFFINGRKHLALLMSHTVVFWVPLTFPCFFPSLWMTILIVNGTLKYI